jgi:Rieske Fe-S protein
MVTDPDAPTADEASEDPRPTEAAAAAVAASPERRRFLGDVSRVAMAAGLVGGYGAFGLVAGRYLYPARPTEMIWQYVNESDRRGVGASMAYRGPSGEAINVVRQGDRGDVDDFIALSSTCPHLGCQVHWEPQNDRYFCPCHSGAFDPSGVATSGPPADAGQSLPRYRLRIDGGLLFIEVPAIRLVDDGMNDRVDGGGVRAPDGSSSIAAGCASRGGVGISAPGHDRCLDPVDRLAGNTKA